MTKPRFKFLCNPCAFGGRYDIGRVTSAKFPEFAPTKENILACPRIHEMKPGTLLTSTRTQCDDCGATIYYAPSSDWIVQNAERIRS